MEPACCAEFKSKGNAAFQAHDYQTAAEWFTQGIEVDGANHVLFSNRSAAFAGLKQFGEALADADRCISLRPDWGKGYARRGYARAGLGDHTGALQAYRQGLTVEPGLSILQEGVARHDLEVTRQILMAAGPNSVLDSLDLFKWEGRIDELMDGQPDATCSAILDHFIDPHLTAMRQISSTDPSSINAHSLAAARLQERRAKLLGKMERFRDQGMVLCQVGDSLVTASKFRQASSFYQRARDVAEAHGFFSVECQACLGLGLLSVVEGRDKDGEELLRNALAAVNP